MGINTTQIAVLPGMRPCAGVLPGCEATADSDVIEDSMTGLIRLPDREGKKKRPGRSVNAFHN